MDRERLRIGEGEAPVVAEDRRHEVIPPAQKCEQAQGLGHDSIVLPIMTQSVKTRGV